MPKVECFSISGLECWFWSNDHDPPHFHVKSEGEWELRVNFLLGEADMFELLWGKSPKAKVRKNILEAVVANRAALLNEWQTKVNHDN